jgi:hypothetical protein
MPGTSLQVLQPGFLLSHAELFAEDLARPWFRAIGAWEHPTISDSAQLCLETP